MNVKVSVIIPAYNAAAFIADAIESVLSQTYRKLEIIVVNDGSTDATAEVLSLYRDKISYFEQPNGGAASARNTGIRHARGEFIAFLDADDLWLPTKIEKQLRVYEELPDTGLVYSQMVDFENDSGQELRVFPCEVPSGKLFERLLVENLIPLPSVLMTSRLLREAGGFDESLVTAEDTNLWLRVARQHAVFGLPEVLVRRRKHANNISDRLDIAPGTLSNLDRLVIAYPELGPKVYPAMKKAYLMRGGDLIHDYFHYGRYHSCRQACRRLMQIDPLNVQLLAYFLLTLIPGPLLRSVQMVVRRVRRSTSAKGERK